MCPCGAPHDPKALLLSDGGRDLCGHAELFSTRKDMVRFAQALLSGELLRLETLREIGVNRTGFFTRGRHVSPISGLSLLCQTSAATAQRGAALDGRALHRPERLHGQSSVPRSGRRGALCCSSAIAVTGVCRTSSRQRRKDLSAYGLDARGVGLVRWSDGRLVPSSAKYVYFKRRNAACADREPHARTRLAGLTPRPFRDISSFQSRRLSSFFRRKAAASSFIQSPMFNF